MYCIQHTLLNNLSYCLFYFTNPILHHIAIRPLIHMGLSDNPTQKKITKILFFVPIQNITLLYLMCAVEG